VITDGWTETLRCSRCAGRFEISTDTLRCPRCGTAFPIDDGIPVLHDDETIGTMLEQIDYDEVHGVTDRVIDKTGAQWSELFDRFGLERGEVLEIGAGTGVLTLGLLRQGAVGHITATDVSHKFLSMLAPRLEPFSTAVSLVACDANVPHFAEQTFDVVVGRSILHHLLDYDETLRQCSAVLKPGGAAIFFEPVLEGKIIVAMLMSLILGADAMAGGHRLSAEQRKRMKATIGHQMKSTTYPQDRESLSRLEDKYIFHIEQMKQAGRDAGFAETDFINNGEQVPSYWPNVVRISKVPAQTLEPYRWVCTAFANTYAKIFPEVLSTPMGFFVFRKSSRPGAATSTPAQRTQTAPAPKLAVARQSTNLARAPRTYRARALSRIVVALARGGLSVRGSRELLVSDGATPVRALVFVVAGNSERFLVAANANARWVKLLRAAGRAELRLGRRSEAFRAAEVRGETRKDVVQTWRRRVGAFGTPKPTPEPVVFRIDAL
jgi:ubiquinone/menaquinone biosynthesis C-methylase UbiE/uncharacterized protein YbaR (Trm112 family)